jgi:phospholipid/cholesterol/gamma-HCH transport system substrate-binding protein
METRASYLLVGVFALIAMAGFAISAVWMMGSNLDSATARYVIFFKGSVSGLKVGNAVQYRGIPVGVVSGLEINPKNVEEVRATIEISPKTPVKTDTVAGLGYQGITGVAYIELTGGTHTAPALEPTPGEKLPVIMSKASQLQELFDAAPELVTRVTHLVNLAVRFLGSQNQENVAKILDNVSTITGSVAGKSEEIGTVISDLRVAVNDVRGMAVDADATVREIGALAKSVRTLSDTLEQEVHGVGPAATQSMKEIGNAATEFRRTAIALSDIIDRNKGAVDTFASSGLYELTQLLADMRVLVNALTRISGQIEQDPARFLFGKTQPSLEVK